QVADHVVLKPDGFVFAPHPAVTDTDRDKYCVRRIIDFYKRHEVDYADYFQAAWRYHHRAKLGRPRAELSAFAAEASLSSKYLALVWSILAEAEAGIGPEAAVQQLWRKLRAPVGPASRAGPDGPEVRPGKPDLPMQRMRELVLRLRKELRPSVKKVGVNGI